MANKSLNTRQKQAFRPTAPMPTTRGQKPLTRGKPDMARKPSPKPSSR